MARVTPRIKAWMEDLIANWNLGLRFECKTLALDLEAIARECRQVEDSQTNTQTQTGATGDNQEI
jgi:hypothetical protein